MIYSRFRSLALLAFAVSTVSLTSSAFADTIAWTKWSSVTPGNPGSAKGTLTSSLYGTIDVSYSGQASGLLVNYPSWTPTSTFTGGIAGNAPPAANNSVQLVGGQPYTETINFSVPVVDPLFAIWSLGSPGVPAYFIFTADEPFNNLGGGRSTEYGGSGLVISGESIFGREGNGLVQFIGTYSSLTFTTPNFENYYAFTVGEDATQTDNPGNPPPPPPEPSAIPEPGTLSLLSLGLLGLSSKAYSRLRRI
jgi:hypothetical protein